MTVSALLPQPSSVSDGESKVMVFDMELPSPHNVVLNVQLSVNMRHVLDKGPWAATLAVRQGWKIFIEVSCPSVKCDHLY